MIVFKAIGPAMLIVAIALVFDAIVFRLSEGRWPRWGTENHD